MYKHFRNALVLSCYFGSGAVGGLVWGAVRVVMRGSKLRYLTTPAAFIFVCGLSYRMADIASDEVCDFADSLHDIWVRSKEEPETEEK